MTVSPTNDSNNALPNDDHLEMHNFQGPGGKEETDVEIGQEPPKTNAPQAYSVFTVNQKRAIVASASMASFFSPMSSSIYYPAVGTISTDLGVSVTNIDLTITMYLVSVSFKSCGFGGN